MVNRRGRVLIVEDDVKTSETAALYLRHAGYDVAQCFDGQAALEKAQIWEPDLVVLDLMLPKVSGLEVCAKLRARGDVSIIMLTAKTTETDRLHGLESGADDYVSKPFSPRELAARVKAVMRRHAHVPNERISFGELEIDAGARDARVNDVALKLTPTEFGLLLALCRQPKIVRTRDELIGEVIGFDYEGTERTIDVHVRNLRRKIGDAGAHRTHIRAVFGAGYRIESDG
jgi:DNA-binding response OmpR family regulator